MPYCEQNFFLRDHPDLLQSSPLDCGFQMSPAQNVSQYRKDISGAECYEMGGPHPISGGTRGERAQSQLCNVITRHFLADCRCFSEREPTASTVE